MATSATMPSAYDNTLLVTVTHGCEIHPHGTTAGLGMSLVNDIKKLSLSARYGGRRGRRRPQTTVQRHPELRLRHNGMKSFDIFGWHDNCYVVGDGRNCHAADTRFSTTLLISSKQGSIPPLFSPGLNRGFFCTIPQIQDVGKNVSGVRCSQSR
jgi:hypothetical protein